MDPKRAAALAVLREKIDAGLARPPPVKTVEVYVPPEKSARSARKYWPDYDGPHADIIWDMFKMIVCAEPDEPTWELCTTSLFGEPLDYPRKFNGNSLATDYCLVRCLAYDTTYEAPQRDIRRATRLKTPLARLLAQVNDGAIDVDRRRLRLHSVIYREMIEKLYAFKALDRRPSVLGSGPGLDTDVEILAKLYPEFHGEDPEEHLSDPDVFDWSPEKIADVFDWAIDKSCGYHRLI